MRKIFLGVFALLLTWAAVYFLYFNSSHDLNIQGGMPFMVVLNALLFVNIALMLYVIIAFISEKSVDSRLLGAIKQIGGLAAAWGTWSTILGLFFAFDAIEASEEVIPFRVICGGLKVAVITVLFGLIIYCHALLGYIGLNLARKTEN